MKQEKNGDGLDEADGGYVIIKVDGEVFIRLNLQVRFR